MTILRNLYYFKFYLLNKNLEALYIININEFN
jgi:hypothetical protein